MVLKFKYLLFCCLLFSLFACEKGDNRGITPPPDIDGDSGLSEIYILCEGLMDMNNTTLFRYSFEEKKLDKNYFLTKNRRGLGDTGNDMQVYGSKMYIAVSVSSQLEVIDLHTGKSIRQISFFDEKGKPRQPRYLAFDKDKAYLCCFDGQIARIDTASLEIEALTPAGHNPDGICVAGNKLYVSNSGGLDQTNNAIPDYENTVSVIDIPTFTEIRKITVNRNPYRIAADGYGDVYVSSRGNYADEKYGLLRIDSRTDEVVQSFDQEVLGFCIAGDYAYLYKYDFFNASYWIKVLNVKTEQIERDNFITDGTEIKTPYGIAVNETTGDLFVADAYDFMVAGDLLCFDRDGKLKYRIGNVGLNPNRIVFVEKKE